VANYSQHSFLFKRSWSEYITVVIMTIATENSISANIFHFSSLLTNSIFFLQVIKATIFLKIRFKVSQKRLLKLNFFMTQQLKIFFFWYTYCTVPFSVNKHRRTPRCWHTNSRIQKANFSCGTYWANFCQLIASLSVVKKKI